MSCIQKEIFSRNFKNDTFTKTRYEHLKHRSKQDFSVKNRPIFLPNTVVMFPRAVQTELYATDFCLIRQQKDRRAVTTC